MNTTDVTRKPLSPQKKQAVSEQLWLSYFNETLYAKGVITEEQRNKMRSRIKCRPASGRPATGKPASGKAASGRR